MSKGDSSLLQLVRNPTCQLPARTHVVACVGSAADECTSSEEHNRLCLVRAQSPNISLVKTIYKNRKNMSKGDSSLLQLVRNPTCQLPARTHVVACVGEQGWRRW